MTNRTHGKYPLKTNGGSKGVSMPSGGMRANVTQCALPPRDLRHNQRHVEDGRGHAEPPATLGELEGAFANVNKRLQDKNCSWG